MYAGSTTHACAFYFFFFFLVWYIYQVKGQAGREKKRKGSLGVYLTCMARSVRAWVVFEVK